MQEFIFRIAHSLDVSRPLQSKFIPKHLPCAVPLKSYFSPSWFLLQGTSTSSSSVSKSVVLNPVQQTSQSSRFLTQQVVSSGRFSWCVLLRPCVLACETSAVAIQVVSNSSSQPAGSTPRFPEVYLLHSFYQVDIRYDLCRLEAARYPMMHFTAPRGSSRSRQKVWPTKYRHP